MTMAIVEKESSSLEMEPSLTNWLGASPAIAVEGDLGLTELHGLGEETLGGLTLPTVKDEEWQFTDLGEFKSLAFQAPVSSELEESWAANFYLPEAQNTRLVFVNGQGRGDLSCTDGLPQGVIWGHWSSLTPAQREQCGPYLHQSLGEKAVFAALNDRQVMDMAVLWIPPDVTVLDPIHCVFLTVVEDIPRLMAPRLLVIAGSNSRATLVESYGAIANNCTDRPQHQPYGNNGVSQIFLGDNATLTHIRNQRDSGDSLHLATTAIAQQSHSHYTLHDINLGAKLSRHTLSVHQQGPATTTELFALTAIEGRQVSDTHSQIYLNHPHGITRQLHKCIVDGYGQAVFNGKVFVPRPAQLTQAEQLNRNLLLSSKGRVNTKPELQITADNVKCSHGATISQLEADEIFYLQSRGLNDADARHLLIDAFAGEILDGIPIPSLQHRLRQCMACRTL